VNGFVEGASLPPAQTIPNPTPSTGSLDTVANSAFFTWLQQDQMVLGTIMSTISESLISQVMGYSISNEVWRFEWQPLSIHIYDDLCNDFFEVASIVSK
jgi:hypothetical protein